MKILTFSGRGLVVHHITRDMSDALAEAGAQTRHVEYSGKDLNPLFDALDEFQPHVLLTVDYQISRQNPLAFQNYPDMIHAAWWTDDPVLLGLRGTVERDVHFCVDDAWKMPILETGSKRVFSLPLCTNPAVFEKPEGDPEYRHDVSFLGSTRFSHNLKNFVANLQLSPPALKAIEELVEHGAENPGAPLPELLHRLAWGDIDIPLDAFKVHFRYMLPLKMRETSGALTRIRFCNYGLDRPYVYGPEEWERYIKDGRRLPGFEYGPDAAALYASTRVNLNFHAGQLPTGLNQRCFDAPAAGGFVLSDYRADMKRLFRDDEVAFFRDRNEYAEKIHQYLMDEDARLEMTEKARARVLKEHTYLHRAQTALDTLKNLL